MPPGTDASEAKGKPAYALLTFTEEIVRDADPAFLWALRKKQAADLRDELGDPTLPVGGQIIPDKADD